MQQGMASVQSNSVVVSAFVCTCFSRALNLHVVTLGIVVSLATVSIALLFSCNLGQSHSTSLHATLKEARPLLILEHGEAHLALLPSAELAMPPR